MTPIGSIVTCLLKIATFRARASRSEFWWFHLFFALFLIAGPLLIDAANSTLNLDNNTSGQSIKEIIFLIPFTPLYFAHLSVIVRRLHDTNSSGWWFWIWFVPVIGVLTLIFLLCKKGTRGDNDYGSDPLGEDLSETFVQQWK